MKHRPPEQIAVFDRIDGERLTERCRKFQDKAVGVRTMIRCAAVQYLWEISQAIGIDIASLVKQLCGC